MRWFARSAHCRPFLYQYLPKSTDLLARIRARNAAHPVSLTAEQIFAFRDEDRL